MTEALILAIDQGTTGTSVLLFDHDGRIVGRAYSEFTQHYPRPGWVEQDAGEIWDVSVAVVARALEEAGVDPAAVIGIGITNQRETVVMWDRSSGEPVGRAIVWQDRRTSSYCEELREAGHAETIRKITGLVVDPYFSGTKISWLLRQDPDLRTRAASGEVAFGTIDSWLVYKMTGEHVTDRTNASRTLLYDTFAGRWSSDLLELFDVPETILPEVRPSSGVFALSDPDQLCGIKAPIAGIAGDQQAALFGQACFGAGEAKNTYGTGSFVLMHTGTEPVRAEGLLTTIAASGADEISYALEGSIFVTGAAVQWLRDGLGVIDHAARSEDLARKTEGNDGVYFVPALTGLGSPHWNPRARGLLIGLTRGTTSAHITRASLESIAYQTRDVLDAMEEGSGIHLEMLRADGGATANSFLMQFQADQLQRPVEVAAISETTALGAAFLAGLAVGFWSDEADLGAARDLGRTYQPAAPAAEADALYERWKEAVQRSLDWARD